MIVLFRWLARLPLTWLQACGAVLGWLVWWGSPTYRRQFHRQVAGSGVDPRRARAAIAATGRMVAELPWVWARPHEDTLSWRVTWDGQDHVQAALAAGRGVIIMSPHIGSWEVGAQALAEAFAGQDGAWVVLARVGDPPGVTMSATACDGAAARVLKFGPGQPAVQVVKLGLQPVSGILLPSQACQLQAGQLPVIQSQEFVEMQPTKNGRAH